MTINFNQITILDIEGNEKKVSVSRDLGNTMYMQGENIEECELGKTIYHAEADMDLTTKQAEIVKKYITRYAFVVRNAIENILNQ